ncbi:MAG: hypothetical protein ABL921_25410 [Pirellula sp.]
MPYVPTPLLYGNFLHVTDDMGVYTCLDPVSGKALKTKRKGGNSYSSPIGVADRIYLFEDSGACLVLANNDRFEVLAKNQLREPIQTTPAFSNGAMYVRSESHL